MNFESLNLLLLLFAPILLVFLLEAMVMLFYKLKSFWPCFAASVLLNLLSLLLIYVLASPLLGVFGYDTAQFNGLNLQPPVLAFLWWFSVIAEGLLLQAFFRKIDKKKIFIAAIVMNLLSFLFLYAFIELSH